MIVESWSETTYASTLCWSGCRSGTSLAVSLALSDPLQFVKCYARKIHVPVKIAVDRCRTVNVTDAFFDSCVFDLMLTGNEYLVEMAKDVQTDFRRHLPLHYRQEEGRTDLDIRLGTPQYKFDNCLSQSSTVLTMLSVVISLVIVHSAFSVRVYFCFVLTIHLFLALANCPKPFVKHLQLTRVSEDLSTSLTKAGTVPRRRCVAPGRTSASGYRCSLNTN
uniref:RGM_C domain-containing protein n=1 Tax=Heterorhabditis bacteriophora TaxID=37862 RepID=A0A1I7WFS8_HETBA